jgi:8-oxo-dGTP diphosphatase
MKSIPVTCAVIWFEGKILCAKRSATMSQPGLWEFPGGKVEQGELLEDCLTREILEELNISIRIVIAMSPSEFSYSSDKTIRLLPFLCTWESGLIQLLEHEEVRWLTKEELFSVNWAPADLPIAQELDRFWNPVRKLILKDNQPQKNAS